MDGTGAMFGNICYDGREIPVEYLDFDYIENRASDWEEMKAIVAILESGKEGMYPALLEAAEKKLLELMPAKEKRLYLVLKSNPSSVEEDAAKEDVVTALAELASLDSARHKDNNRNGADAATNPRSSLIFDEDKTAVGSAKTKRVLPPIRGTKGAKITVKPTAVTAEGDAGAGKARRTDSRKVCFIPFTISSSHLRPLCI